MNKENIKKNKNQVINKLTAEIEALKQDIRTDVLGPVVASFGFIIALIWRDAIQATINEFLSRAGLVEDFYIYQIISAIIVTIVVIGIMIAVVRIGQKRKRKKLEKRIKQKTEKLHNLQESNTQTKNNKNN